MRKIFITGIGTDIGKTIVSAILTEALEADYWKPVQAGNLNNSDTQKVKELISNARSIMHPESYRLTQPMSPHAAAKIDGVKMDLNKIQIPNTNNHLIIEGAGGLMVPLNDKDLIMDLIKKWNAEVILVSSNYLGSINHTLLSLESLKVRNLKVKGIIFNGEKNKTSEDYILNYSGVDCLGRISQHQNIDKEIVLGYKKVFSKL